ncbi:MAG: hypothetical protein FWE05_06015 [Defluviitaleaceae bacterium]|nr:hypothetical protein [Defluviitaleaceae bacterium]
MNREEIKEYIAAKKINERYYATRKLKATVAINFTCLVLSVFSTILILPIQVILPIQSAEYATQFERIFSIVIIFLPSIYAVMGTIALLFHPRDTHEIHVITFIANTANAFSYFFSTLLLLYLGQRGVLIMLEYTSSVSEFVVVTTSILGLIVIAISHFFRYQQASMLGIPLKVTMQQNAHEIIDLLVLVFLIGVVGIIVPPAIMLSNMVIDYGIPLIMISVTVGICTAWSRLFNISQIERKGLNFFFLIFVTILALASAILFIWFYVDLQNASFMKSLTVVTMLSIPTLIIYSYLIFMIFCLGCVISRRIYDQRQIFDKYKTPMTVCIDETLYLVAMRHTKEKWILIPCEIVENHLGFKKGEFIIRSLDELTIQQRKYEGIIKLGDKIREKSILSSIIQLIMGKILVLIVNVGCFLPLKCIKKSGNYQLSHTFQRRIRNGHVFIMWVKPSRNFPDNPFVSPVILNENNNTKGKHISIANGVSYCVSVKSQKEGRFKRKKVVIDAEVNIAIHRIKTGVWIMSYPLVNVTPPYQIHFTDAKTVYRSGFWINSDIDRLISLE